jgi:putative hydrolase of the HAD superfamily
MNVPHFGDKIRAIFFDLDDTLLDYKRAERIAALRFREEHGLHKWAPEAFVQKWNALMNEHFALFFAGTITFEEQRRRRVRAIFENQAMPDEEADIIFETYSKNYEASWALFADTVPCLDAVKRLRLGLITNGQGAQQRRKLMATGIDQRFEAVVISSEHNFAKPDPRIFLEACRQLEVKPEECVMVGDNWKGDILGAQSAGMHALWLCRDGERPAGQDGISSLNDLPALLAG